MYKTQDFAVSDVWLAPNGTAYLAGTVVGGKLRDVVPGKVRDVQHRLRVWKEMAVDYRAEAHRVTWRRWMKHHVARDGHGHDPEVRTRQVTPSDFEIL